MPRHRRHILLHQRIPSRKTRKARFRPHQAPQCQNRRILDKTWNSGVKVEEVRIERRPYQFLYKDDMGYNFMHTETFEQVAIPARASKVLNSSRRATCAKLWFTLPPTPFSPVKCLYERGSGNHIHRTRHQKATQPPIHSNPPQWKPAPKYAFPFSAT